MGRSFPRLRFLLSSGAAENRTPVQSASVDTVKLIRCVVFALEQGSLPALAAARPAGGNAARRYADSAHVTAHTIAAGIEQ